MTTDSDHILVRCLYYRRGDELREVRYIGRRILSDEPAPVILWEHRELFWPEAATKPVTVPDNLWSKPPREWPWEEKSTALVKEGPKALALIS